MSLRGQCAADRAAVEVLLCSTYYELCSEYHSTLSILLRTSRVLQWPIEARVRLFRNVTYSRCPTMHNIRFPCTGLCG